MKNDDIVTIGGIGLAAVGAFLLGRSMVAKAAEEDIEEGAEELKAADPTLTDEEATAAAAAALAAEALLAAQQTELQHLLDELAAAVERAENELAAAEGAAILNPEDVAAQEAAAQAEAQAEADRKELELQWTKSLNDAQAELVTAQKAAEVATGAYLSAKRNVGIWETALEQDEKRLIDARIKFGVSVYIPPTEWWLSATDEERAALTRLMTNLEIFIIPDDKANIGKWRQIESRTSDHAIAAITAANLVVERVLTITADVRLLGILLSLARRTDTLAIATRTKLAELQARIE